MSDEFAAVVNAAAFLDKWSEYKDWRTKVDVDRLNMDSAYDCVLGQLYGEYFHGKTRLRDAAGSSLWGNVSATFCGYDEEWKNYLRNGVAGALSGIWYTKNQGRAFRILSTFQDFGTTYVVYRAEDATTQYTKTEAAFRVNFQPTKPLKYVPGKLYKGTDRDDSHAIVFMFHETASFGEPGFLRLDSGTHADTDFTETTYGPLKPVHILNKNAGIIGTLES